MTFFLIQIRAYMSRLRHADGSWSDCLAILNAYSEWQEKKRTHYFQKPQSDRDYGVAKEGAEQRWCHANYLQLKVLWLDKKSYYFQTQKALPVNEKIEDIGAMLNFEMHN